MSSLVEHATAELQAAGLFSEDSDYEGMLGRAVLELVEAFAKQGHSGASAGLAISVFTKLARFEPLVPLTGADSEWVEVAEEDGKPLYQNKRCSRVFKCGDAAWDIDGKVFRDPRGFSYTCRESRVPVTFPYVPTTEVVERSSQAEND